MDSLTQALLGATTFALVQDKRIGKKALWIGAAAGTLPDLDVLLSSFYNEVEFLTVHRGFSHSIFFAVMMSILLGRWFHKVFKERYSLQSWYIAFFLAIFTHPLLDVCTSYGTQLLNPISNYLFSTHNIFVIEPTYTLILLVGFLALLFIRNFKSSRQYILKATLLTSCIFLAWTFVSQGIAKSHFVSELKRQKIAYEDILVAPTPLNTLLWSGIAKTDSAYYIASYSILDKGKTIEFFAQNNRIDLLPKIEEHALGKKYLHYCKNYPYIEKDTQGAIRVFALKYGPVNFTSPPEYLFPLVIKRSDTIPYLDNSDMPPINKETFRQLYARILGKVR